MVTAEGKSKELANGGAMAAFVAAGIGAFATGLIVILNEAGILAAPALYGPAGGVSGRTTFAAAVWLVAWAILHRQWRGREIESGRGFAITLVLIGFGVLLTFPPLWALF